MWGGGGGEADEEMVGEGVGGGEGRMSNSVRLVSLCLNLEEIQALLNAKLSSTACVSLCSRYGQCSFSAQYPTTAYRRRWHSSTRCTRTQSRATSSTRTRTSPSRACSASAGFRSTAREPAT